MYWNYNSYKMVIVDVLNLYVIKCVDSILEVVVDR